MITPASVVSIVSTLASVFPAFGSGGHVLPIEGRARMPVSAGVQRPDVVENGSNVVVRPLALPPNVQPPIGGFAFTPDGSVYFPYSFGGALYRFDPAGNLTLIPLKRAGNVSPIIFAHHKLWTVAYPSGVVNVDPDGSNRTWFPLTSHAMVTVVNDIAAQGDGTYLATALESTRQYPPPLVGAITRIGPQNTIATTLLPYGTEAISAGDHGNVYFTYFGQGVNCGIGRLAPSGTIKYFPVPNCALKPYYSSGYLYFLQFYGMGLQTTSDFSKMNVTTGVVTHIGLPVHIKFNAEPGQMSIDFGGNVWMSVLDNWEANTYQLFNYNVRTGRFKGPIEAGIINDMAWGNVEVGPDDNIYAFDYPGDDSTVLDVYVKHVQMLLPASLSITTASPASFSISETHYNGPWTAVSLEPKVAAVFPATSANGTFSVAEVAQGTAQIQVTDSLGNISYETITAQ